MKGSAKLHQLKDAQRRRHNSHDVHSHSAARSHEANDAYMEEFERAWDEMQQLSIGTAGRLQDQPTAAGSMSKHSIAKKSTSTTRSRAGGLESQLSPIHTRQKYASHIVPGWKKGPHDSAGEVIDLSDRPLLCSSPCLEKGEIAIGGSDHAVHVISVEAARKVRTLHTKSCGHAEWVTCVTYMHSGDIVSGGMDSKVCFWKGGASRCIDLKGHSGPISQVQEVGQCIVSSSYDKTIKMWQGTSGRMLQSLEHHKAPILEMAVSNTGKLVAGDRGGHLILWDVSKGDVAWQMKNVHKGHVTALTWFEPEADSQFQDVFISGGQDGFLRVWDSRDKSHVAKVRPHASESRGTGAVSDIIAGGDRRVLTCGADCTFQSSDPRMDFKEVFSVKLSDFPYSMSAAGGLGLVGCSDGILHVIGLEAGKVLYGLGANQAAVRTIDAWEDGMVCAGDDGNAIVYTFLSNEIGM